MEELLFKKGQLANLPEDRQNGTFYVAEDAKTIYLNDMILQDTENVKKELTDIIVDNELVTAEALAYLYDNKADVDALNALESKIPIRTSQLSNDSGFVTASDIPNMDLSGYSPIGHTHDDRYYTESEMNTKLEAKQNTISDLETIRANAAKGATALQAIPEGYATEEYVNNKISDLVNGAPDTLDTLDEIAAALKDNADIVTVLEGAISNKLDKDALSGYTTIEAYEELKAEVAENEYVAAQALTQLNLNKADKTEIPTSTSQLTNDSGFITASEIPSIDESKFALKSDIPDVSNFITSIPSEYITESELNAKGYLTEHQSLTHLATKDELNAKQDALVSGTNIKTVNGVSLLGEGDIVIEGGISDEDLQVIEGKIPTSTSQLSNDSDFITLNDVKANGYIYKVSLTQAEYDALEEKDENALYIITDISQDEDDRFVSKSELDAAIADIPTKTSDLENDSAFITIDDIANQGYATEEFVESGLTTLHDEITEIIVQNELVVASALNALEDTKASVEALETVKVNIPTSTSQLKNDSGFITASEVPSVDESKFALKSDIPDVSNFITSIPSEYVTDSELNEKGYATSGYVDTKIAELVNGAPETLDTLDELAAALKDNKDIVTVLENAISNKLDKDALSGYTTVEAYEELKAEVAENEYVAAQALTHLNSTKADKTDIPTSTSQLKNDSGFITASEIPSVDESKFALKSEIPDVSNFITSIPSEYITESELNEKGYLTTSELDATLESKGYSTEEYVESGLTTLHDEIINIIIENELVVSHALTKLNDTKADKNEIPNSTSQLKNDSGFITASEIPSMDLANYVTDSELADKGYATSGYVDTKIAELVNGAPETLDTLDELAAALKDNKDIVDVLNNSIATKQDAIADLATIRTNAEKGATALQYIPDEYVTDAELTAKGYATESYVDTKVGSLFTLATETDINNLFN